MDLPAADHFIVWRNSWWRIFLCCQELHMHPLLRSMSRHPRSSTQRKCSSSKFCTGQNIALYDKARGHLTVYTSQGHLSGICATWSVELSNNEHSTPLQSHSDHWRAGTKCNAGLCRWTLLLRQSSGRWHGNQKHPAIQCLSCESTCIYSMPSFWQP